MIQTPAIKIIALYLFLFIAALNTVMAQVDCVLQPPVVNIDFGSGSGTSSSAVEFSLPDNYQPVDDYCPQDGYYAIVSSTSDCFRHWLTLPEDHTPGDIAGNVILVNASYQPGLFFTAPLRNLKPNTIYELSAWLLNVCKPESECTALKPSLIFFIQNNDGKQLARFSTGELAATGMLSWLRYSARFTTPANEGLLFLKIEDVIVGGCGNDFAMDDITVRECVVPKPIVKDKPKPAIKQVAEKKPVVKPQPPVPLPAKKIIPADPNKTVRDTPLISRVVIKQLTSVPLPKPILTRANPIIKQIETVTAEIVIDLYDNGEIDGDTVSIYHNNELIVSRAGLSDKPITFRFKVDAAHPHHELIMVANNLGSIPPNTSLMIVTAKDKRYEVFISSTEEKNAKIVIDLKE